MSGADDGVAASHRLVFAAVREGARVLDVGCGTGALAAALKERGCTVVGIDADPVAAAQARKHCDAVITGDVEAPRTRAETASRAPFDVVVCANVLEYLRDPWEVLAWLRTLLRDGGRAIVSVPNFGHWRARRELLRGRFPQPDATIFDRAQLRFFTSESARDLAALAGYEVLEEHPVPGRLRGPLVRRYPGLLAVRIALVLAPQRPA